jgi:phage terminase small subunit
MNEKQKRFADYYIELGNATEAARRAGYKGKNLHKVASENLTKLDIKAYIAEKLKQLEDTRIADAKEVMQYLTSVLRGEVQEECVVTESVGDFMSEARLIKKQVSPKDRNKAAELLAKRYGLLTENVALSGEVGVKIIDDIE